MTQKPFFNAFVAAGYIGLIGLFFQYAQGLFGPVDTILAPITMISLFTFSAAVMGYIFCYLPLRLFLEGEKERAVRLFLSTVGAFAVMIFGFLVAMFVIARV